MAALVQTYPQHATVTMLQGRPSSSGGYQPQSQQMHPGLRSPPTRYNQGSTSGYRGTPSHAPVAPYAFTSTPHLTSNNNQQQRQYQIPHLRPENRSSSAPIVPHSQQLSMPAVSNGPGRPRNLAQSPVSSSSSNSSVQHTPRTMDDSSLILRSSLIDSSSRPQFTLGLPASSSMTSIGSLSPAKPSPDRYRRNVRRVDSGDSGPNRMYHMSSMPSGSGMSSVGHLYTHPAQSNSSPTLQNYESFRARPQNAELAKRYRRRSLGSLETAGLNHAEDAQSTPSPHPNSFIQTSISHSQSQSRDNHHMPNSQPPTSSHTRNASAESVSSAKSAHSSRPSSARNEPTPQAPVSPALAHVSSTSKQEVRQVNVPSRYAEPIKRANNPSPLSRPTNVDSDLPSTLPAGQSSAAAGSAQILHSAADSPAAQHLAAVSEKDIKKSKSKSKLRRAFSFGSASELRRASAQKSLEKSAKAEPTPISASKRNSKYEDEMEPEQAKIAQKQEANGLGESIYSGQGHFFTGSTDNVSISSTASSASIMLRKMGQGVKKGTRSFVGLFRPKSVIGVLPADGPVNHANAAQVSMVTVEAEREKVNVNLDPHDQAGGGTGFPRLERNSIDAQNSVESGGASNDTRSRRSIVGGERERAEVLASVKKGILKRNDSGQSSPPTRPYDFKTPDFNLPQIPHVNDSPHSSAPSTPIDDSTSRNDHRRTDSITIEGGETEDYFSSITGFGNPESKDVLLTPRTVARNISWNSRVQFHDTWPSGEYDRRGEIATCNRLTPMLAQQIKEELNTFKMEMEVHESSKVYTHFF